MIRGIGRWAPMKNSQVASGGWQVHFSSLICSTADPEDLFSLTLFSFNGDDFPFIGAKHNDTVINGDRRYRV